MFIKEIKHRSLPSGKGEGGLGRIMWEKMNRGIKTNGALPLKFNQGKMFVTKKYIK